MVLGSLDIHILGRSFLVFGIAWYFNEVNAYCQFFFFFKYGFSICELLHLLMDWISFGRFFSELKKNFLKTDVSQRLCFWSYSFIEAFWLWFWGSGPAGWMRPPSTFRPHPPCALVFVLILLCPDCSFETQGPAYLFLLPLICDQLDSVFQWKKSFSLYCRSAKFY